MLVHSQRVSLNAKLVLHVLHCDVELHREERVPFACKLAAEWLTIEKHTEVTRG